MASWTPITQGTMPYSAYGSDAWTNFAVSQEIDLSIFDVSQGGIYTTGGMYAEELELKDATGITIQTANSNARHKKIFATTSNDGSPFDEMVYYSRGSTGGWSGQHTFTVDKSGTSGTGYEALRIRDSGNGTSSEVLVSHKLGVGILDPVPMLHIYGGQRHHQSDDFRCCEYHHRAGWCRRRCPQLPTDRNTKMDNGY